MKKILGLLTVAVLLPLTTSCGKKTKYVESTVVKKNKLTLEKVRCYSDGSYTECSILNKAKRIIDVSARVNENCLVDTDYYLLNEKVIVTRNGCKADFLIEVK